MVLPLATESQKQPSKTCSKLGLQLTQTTADWPETLAYPLQPYSTNTPDVGEKTSFPWVWGELTPPFSYHEPVMGPPHLSQALRHTPYPVSLASPTHSSCLGSAPF